MAIDKNKCTDLKKGKGIRADRRGKTYTEIRHNEYLRNKEKAKISLEEFNSLLIKEGNKATINFSI